MAQNLTNNWQMAQNLTDQWIKFQLTIGICTTTTTLPPHPDPYSCINELLSQNSSILMTVHSHERSPTPSSNNVNLQRFGCGGIHITSNPRALNAPFGRNRRSLTPFLFAQTSNHSHLYSFVHEPQIKQMSAFFKTRSKCWVKKASSLHSHTNAAANPPTVRDNLIFTIILLKIVWWVKQQNQEWPKHP